jgi:hypothetical protein
MKKAIIILIFLFAIAYTSFAQCSNPDTGEDSEVCGNLVNLSVTSYTTGYWSALRDGVPYPLDWVADLTLPVIQLNIPPYEDPYISIDFVWNDDSGPCSDFVNVIFAQLPIASVGPIEIAEVCGTEFTFNADTVENGWVPEMFWTSPVLSASFANELLPNTIVTIDPSLFGNSAYVTAPFVWNMTNLVCEAKDTMWLSFYQIPDAYAGLDNAFCGMEGELGAVFSLPETSNYTPDVWWTISSVPNPSACVDIYTVNSDTTNIQVTHPGVYEIVFIENNSVMSTCYSKDTVQIEFVEIPVIFAGEDQEVCGTCFEMEVVSAGFNGYWSASCYYEEPDQMYFCCSLYGEHEFVWMEENQSITSTLICSSSDTVVVTNYRIPTANIITNLFDTLSCGLSTQILEAEDPGNGITGYWYSNNLAIIYEDEFTLNPVITVPDYGEYEFYWIEENGPALQPGFCTDTAGPFVLNFLEAPEVFAGLDDSVYGNEYLLHAEVSTEPSEEIPFVNYWSDVAGAIIENQNAVQTEVSVTTFGSYEFVLTTSYENFSSCNDKDTIVIGFLDEDLIESNAIFIEAFAENQDIDLNGDQVVVYLYMENPTKNNEVSLYAEKLNGYANQAVFENLEDGTYYIQSQFIESQDYTSVFSNVYYYQAADFSNAAPISIAGNSMFYCNVEHPLKPVNYGYTLAHGIVGVDNSKSLQGLENMVVVLYDVDNDQVLDVCVTNENGEYSFSDIRGNANISISVSSFEHPDRIPFETRTEAGVDYHVDFVVQGFDVWPVYQSGVEDILIKNNVSIFPNPATNIIKIQSEVELYNIEVYDINGRLVLNVNDNQTAIDISKLENGVYFFTALSDKGKIVRRFVKQ